MTKKELGQHWLRDESILQAIVSSAEVTADDHVLEIGPGQGTLTHSLLDTGAEVTALEFDAELVPALEQRFSSNDRLTILHGDIRKFNFSDMPKDYKIVANIPYYLTSHLVRSITETENQPHTASLLVQKEVAERICAAPGSMSTLSVAAQFYYECSLDVIVPAEFFTPPPKVDSQVVVLKKRDKPAFKVDNKQFFQLVKAGFSEKRKTLRNSLAGGLQLNKEEVEELLGKANIAPTRRAQELSLNEWYTLYVVRNGE